MSRRTIAAIVAALVLLAGIGPATATQGAADGHAQAGTPVDCSFPVTKTDATGTEVTVEEEPQRVVVLAPSAAQTMWEIGAKDKVVGMPVNRFTDYLEGSDSRTDVVDDRGQPVLEKVVAAEPDLVLAPNVIQNETVQSMRDRGLTVYRFEKAKSIEDVYEKTETTGLLVGEFESAAETSATMQGKVDAIRSQVDGEEEPRVYYALGFGYTAGEDSFIGQLINAAGGQNIAEGELNRSYARLSQEVIAQKDPQYIVLPTGTPLPKNDAINQSTAVKKDQIVRVNANYINQPGPRNVQPLKTMAEAFHPDAYDASAVESAEGPDPERCESSITPTPTATPTPTDTPAATDAGTDALTTTPTPTDTPTPTPTETMAEADGDTATDAAGTTAGSGPGFGAVGALVAVLAATLAVSRRRL